MLKTKHLRTIMITILCFIGAFACQKGSNPKKDKSVEQSDSKSQKRSQPKVKMASHKGKTLQSQLDVMSAKYNKMMSPKTNKIFADGIQSLKTSGILEKALKKGDRAPDFELKNAVGKKVKLSGLLKKGPVVLVWYRGGWCPYCNLQLNETQKYLPQIKSLGAALVAITPETPDNSIKMVDKHKLQFEVLSDIDNKVAHRYKIVYQVPDPLNQELKKFKIDIAKHNGNNKNELPLAVTYIINTDGIVSYAFINEDYKKRAEPSELISVLKSM